MDTLLLVLQWVVSIVAIWCIGVPFYAAFLENKLLAFMGIFLMPIFLPIFVVMYWKKHQLKYILATFVICFALAAVFQRARVGFWDWPDVDYKVPAEQANEDD